jgi:hypothetical protein
MSGKPADLVLYEKPEKPTKISYGPEADRVAVAEFGKPFSEAQHKYGPYKEIVDYYKKIGKKANY